MKSLKDTAQQLQTLVQSYREGDESAYKQIETLAWIADTSVDFVIEAFSLDSPSAAHSPEDDAKYTELLEKYEKLKEDYDQLATYCSEAEQSIKELKKNAKAEEKKQQEKTSLNDLQTGRLTTKEIEAIQEAERKAARSVITNMTETIKTLQRESDAAKETITEQSSKLAENEKAIADQKKLIDKHKKAIDEKDRKIKTQQDSELKLNRQLTLLKNEFSKLQETKTKLEEELNEIRNRKTANEEIQEYMDLAQAAETQLKIVKEERDDLALKLTALSEAMSKKCAAKQETGAAVIVRGEEPDLYEGEHTEIIMDILKDAAETLPEGRRRDIVLDIIGANPVKDIPKKNGEKIKNILKGYKTFTGTVERELKDLGIEAERSNRHIKLVYHGDGRYFSTCSATATDVRTGQNAAAEMIKTML